MMAMGSGTKPKPGKGRVAGDWSYGTKLLRSLLIYLQSPNRHPQRTFVNSAKKNLPEDEAEERGGELTSRLMHVLGSAPDFRMSGGAFLAELGRRHGVHCSDVCWLARLCPRVLSLELQKESGEMSVSLAGGKRQALEGQQVLFLFLLKPELELTPDQFIRMFRSVFHFTPDPDALRDAFPEIIKWRQRPDGSMVLELVPVQCFALHSRQVLLSFSYNDVSLRAFTRVYQSRYSRIQPEAFGYSSLIGLIRAASHVLYIKGRGLSSTVCINRNFLGTLRVVRPELFRNGSGKRRKGSVPPRFRRRPHPLTQNSTKMKCSPFPSLVTPALREQAANKKRQKRQPKEEKQSSINRELNRTFDVPEEEAMWPKLVSTEEEANWETDNNDSSSSNSDDDDKTEEAEDVLSGRRLLPPAHFSTTRDSGFDSVTSSEGSQDDCPPMDVVYGRQLLGVGRGTLRRSRLAIRFPV